MSNKVISDLLVIAEEENAKRAAELVIANVEKAKREAELVIANKEKANREAELVIAKEEKAERAAELVIAKEEKEERAAELIIAKEEKADREAELVIANKEKANREEELAIANAEKAMRAAEVIISNTGKAKRAAELLIANVEKAKQAAELVIANIEKAKRAAQFIVMNKELKLAKEKEKLVAELTTVNKELCLQITERKLAEEALLKSETEFRVLAEAMPQIVWITRADGGNIFFNKQWVDYTGLILEESYGSGWIKPFHPDDRHGAWDAWQNAITNMANYSLECRLRRFDGEYKWWLIRGVPVKDADGFVLKWFGTCTDIDEMKIGEESLKIAKHHAEESDQLKSAFLANMSHEIRTPMNGILGFAELLKETDLTGDKQQEYIKIIEESGLRMLNIINNIVDISKIESGLMEVNPKESNIIELMEYVYTFFKPEIENNRLQLLLKSTLLAKEAIITTDREKTYAILTNLVKNAIKYTNEGSIVFGCDKKGDNLEFFIKDTGIGIPRDRQEAIFERFIQAEITDRMARQGAGLGLSITKAYVEMLGGKIWVESEVGVGSTFYFTLPCHSVPEENKAVPAHHEENQINLEVSGLKILIVEDDEPSEKLINIRIQKFGKEVLNARNGFEAVEVCRNNPDIDLILMDIQMPVLNGYDATRQIRQFNKDVVIIAQTAFGLSGDREKAIVAGCNNYISKPIKKDELVSLIQKYFKK